MENVATKKTGSNLVKPIFAIVLVVVVLGFVKWAVTSSPSRNPAETVSQSNSPQSQPAR